jgi:anti-anti-sigma regulatory factor
MTLTPELATANLADLEPGSHLCAFYDSDQQLARIASTFATWGLAAGDQMLYVAGDDDSASTMLTSLLDDAHGTQALASGQLQIRSFADTYGDVHDGDLAPIEAGFRAAAEESRKSGFPALRVAAEMGDFSRFLGSPDEVLRWERRSTAMQRDLGVSSVCQYDLRHVEDRHASGIAAEHQALAPDSHEPPLATFLADVDPWGLRVAGEVDIANRADLIRAIHSRAEVSPRVHLDLHGLTFTDVGTVRGLRAAAAALPHDGHLVLRRPPDLLRRILDLTGLRHQRMVVEP